MPTDLAFSPLERTADLYYRENGAVFGPIQVDTVADVLRLTYAHPPGGEYQTGSRPLSVSEFRVAVVQ